MGGEWRPGVVGDEPFDEVHGRGRRRLVVVQVDVEGVVVGHARG
jgi:hypothetical protein